MAARGGGPTTVAIAESRATWKPARGLPRETPTQQARTVAAAEYDASENRLTLGLRGQNGPGFVMLTLGSVLTTGRPTLQKQ